MPPPGYRSPGYCGWCGALWRLPHPQGGTRTAHPVSGTDCARRALGYDPTERWRDTDRPTGGGTRPPD